MKLTHLGTGSGINGCPTLYATDRDTYVVQGWRVTDATALAALFDTAERARRGDPDRTPALRTKVRVVMAVRLTDEEFLRLFFTVKLTARRLENRNRYDVDTETPLREAFLSGKAPPARPASWNEWHLNVREKTDSGVRFERVRVMDEPLTPYNRFMIYTNRQNDASGEDIRYLARSRANELDLPDHDFWVFDSARLVLMRFTADDRSVGHDLVTDPELIARHEAWIDLALANATPWRDYVAEDPTRAEPPIRLSREVTTGGL